MFVFPWHGGIKVELDYGRAISSVGAVAVAIIIDITFMATATGRVVAVDAIVETDEKVDANDRKGHFLQLLVVALIGTAAIAVVQYLSSQPTQRCLKTLLDAARHRSRRKLRQLSQHVALRAGFITPLVIRPGPA